MADTQVTGDHKPSGLADVAVLTRQVTETRPATLFGCTWAVLAPGELSALLPLADASCWHAVRLTADGRLISGTAQPGEAAARQWAREDRDRLREAEEYHYQRTGEIPEPMTPILRDAPVIRGNPA